MLSPMPIALRLLPLVLLLLLALLFLWQNLTPWIAVVFLGTQLVELPLSLWILGAFGLGIGISVGFGLLLHWARHVKSGTRNLVGETAEPWDDTNWRDRATKQNSTDEDWTGRPLNPPQPPKKVVDAEFRVITPPMRNLDDEDG